MSYHKLKISPEYMTAKLQGVKPWEYRSVWDRVFEVGDSVEFLEFDRNKNEYTGRTYGPVKIVYVFQTEHTFCIFTHTDQCATKTGVGKLPPPPPELTGKIRYATARAWLFYKFVAFCEGHDKVYIYDVNNRYTLVRDCNYDECVRNIASGDWVELDPETGKVKQRPPRKAHYEL
jgi:hypothetical protein